MLAAADFVSGHLKLLSERRFLLLFVFSAIFSPAFVDKRCPPASREDIDIVVRQFDVLLIHHTTEGGRER